MIYTFWIEGLNVERCSSGNNELAARRTILEALSPRERRSAGPMELVDASPAAEPDRPTAKAMKAAATQ